MKDIIGKLKDAEKEINLLRKRCADWAVSYAEKCNDYEDLKRKKGRPSTNFDKRAYQREYMRRRRAKAKAKAEKEMKDD